MGSKKNTEGIPAVSVNVSDKVKNAKPVALITEKWFGTAPHDLQEGLTSQQLPQRELEDCDGEEITVLGFQNRQGTLKGKATNYKILLCADTQGNAFIMITGASVVGRKIDECSSAEALPVRGTLQHKKGGDYWYWDFVA